MKVKIRHISVWSAVKLSFVVAVLPTSCASLTLVLTLASQFAFLPERDAFQNTVAPFASWGLFLGLAAFLLPVAATVLFNVAAQAMGGIELKMERVQETSTQEADKK